jgi:hypothetical protein
MQEARPGNRLSNAKGCLSTAPLLQKYAIMKLKRTRTDIKRRCERDDTRRCTMLTYILVQHTVKDFAEWKKAFDDHHSMRAAAGLTERSLFRGANDPNKVTILLEAVDIDRAKKFTESENLRLAMQKAGVIDKPVISILREEMIGVYAKAA